MKREYRAYASTKLTLVETAESPQLPTLRGIAAPFNSDSQDLGGFVERIMPGAFADAIRSNDVAFLVGHNSSMVGGRTSNGRLKLSEDQTGLSVELNPSDTSYNRDLITNIRDGNVVGMSFGFTVPKGGDRWSKRGDQILREVHKADLFEVSAVTFPAYPATTINAREFCIVDDEAAKKEIERLNKLDELRAKKLRLVKARMSW